MEKQLLRLTTIILLYLSCANLCTENKFSINFKLKEDLLNIENKIAIYCVMKWQKEKAPGGVVLSSNC